MRTIEDYIAILEEHNRTGRPVKSICNEYEHIVLQRVLEHFKTIATVTSSIPIYELEAMCKAKNEGRLIILPCHVGKILYIIDNGEIEKCIANSICGTVGILAHIFSKKDTSILVRNGDIGKMVFFSQEDAEKALEGLK